MEKNAYPYLSPCTKLKSKLIKHLKKKQNTPNLTESKVGNNRQHIGTGDNLLNRPPI